MNETPAPTSAAPVPAPAPPSVEAPDVQGLEGAAAYAGLSRTQTQQFLDGYTERVKANADPSRRTSQSIAETTLRNDWGPNYDRNLQLAKKAVDALGVRGHLQRSGLLNDVQLIKALASVGDTMGPDALQRGATSRDRDAARRAYDAIMKDPNHAFWNRKDPREHRRAVLAVEHLAGIVYGKAPVTEEGVDATTPVARSNADAVAFAEYGEQADAIARAWLSDPNHPLNRKDDPRHEQAVAEYQKLIAVVARGKSVDSAQVAAGLFEQARARRPS